MTEVNHDDWLSVEAAARGLTERERMLQELLATDRAAIKELQATVRDNLAELESVRRLLRATKPRRRKPLVSELPLPLFTDDAP